MSGNVMGVFCYYPKDAAAALIDSIVKAAQEKRFTRDKHDPGFPANAIKSFLGKRRTRLQGADHIFFILAIDGRK